MKSLSHVQLLATPWTAAHQGFSRQEYWSGVPLPSPSDKTETSSDVAKHPPGSELIPNWEAVKFMCVFFLMLNLSEDCLRIWNFGCPLWFSPHITDITEYWNYRIKSEASLYKFKIQDSKSCDIPQPAREWLELSWILSVITSSNLCLPSPLLWFANAAMHFNSSLLLHLKVFPSLSTFFSVILCHCLEFQSIHSAPWVFLV